MGLCAARRSEADSVDRRVLACMAARRWEPLIVDILAVHLLELVNALLGGFFVVVIALVVRIAQFVIALIDGRVPVHVEDLTVFQQLAAFFGVLLVELLLAHARPNKQERDGKLVQLTSHQCRYPDLSHNRRPFHSSVWDCH